jgi:hypothetical protein
MSVRQIDGCIRVIPVIFFNTVRITSPTADFGHL